MIDNSQYIDVKSNHIFFHLPSLNVGDRFALRPQHVQTFKQAKNSTEPLKKDGSWKESLQCHMLSLGPWHSKCSATRPTDQQARELC